MARQGPYLLHQVADRAAVFPMSKELAHRTKIAGIGTSAPELDQVHGQVSLPFENIAAIAKRLKRWPVLLPVDGLKAAGARIFHEARPCVFSLSDHHRIGVL